MKYSEAEKKIEDLLEAEYEDGWSDHYRIKEDDDFFILAIRYCSYAPFEDLLRVSKEEEGWFKARNLLMRDKALADIFMELALTPLNEREEEKKYLVKVWDRSDPEIIAKDCGTGSFSIIPVNAVKDINRQADGSVYQVAFTQAEINHMKYMVSLNIDWDKAVKEFKAHTE